MKNASRARPRRSETNPFRFALARLRTELRWTQDDLCARLSISRRTLSNWECGYWLPPFKQRLHVVVALRDVPPAYVLEIADALGVSVNPAVKPMLQPFHDALDGAAAPAAPPRARPSPAQLRAAMDAVVREAADALDARPNDVRSAIARALDACDALGASLEEARVAAAPAAKVAKDAKDASAT